VRAVKVTDMGAQAKRLLPGNAGKDNWTCGRTARKTFYRAGEDAYDPRWPAWRYFAHASGWRRLWRKSSGS